MATQVLGNQKMDALETPAFSGLLAQMLDSYTSETEPQFREGDGLYFSCGKALRGARGFLVAIGLEGAVLLSAFGVWQFFRLLR